MKKFKKREWFKAQKVTLPFKRNDRTKVFIRLDRHLMKIRLSGLLKRIWQEWSIPEAGFKKIADFEKWQKEKLWNNKDKLEKWQQTLMKALRVAKLPEYYLNTVENYITLNIQGADVELPGIPHHRTDLNYLRAKKLIELSSDSKTGKKIKPSKVAELYQPPENWSDKKYDHWIDKYGVGSGDAVSKIISKHKKRLLK